MVTEKMFEVNGYSPLEYAEKFIASQMVRIKDAADLSTIINDERGAFTYQQAVLLRGIQEIYKRTGNSKYRDYIARWLESTTNEEGFPHDDGKGWCSLESLDFRQPASLCFDLYEETKDKRYWNCIDYLYKDMKDFVQTKEGGFFHATYNPDQMWLDGLYMVGSNCIKYAKMTNDDALLELAMKQPFIMYKNNRDEKTGLLKHAYDESRKAKWADKTTGQSAHVWGRAAGWYATAIMEMYEALPENYDQEKRVAFENLIKEYFATLVKYQAECGRWYQVLEVLDDDSNWLDNSGTFLILSGMAKAITNGILDESYAENILRGYRDVIESSLRIGKQGFDILDISAGACLGNYMYYISRNRVVNDYHGTGGFLMMCASIDKMLKKSV